MPRWAVADFNLEARRWLLSTTMVPKQLHFITGNNDKLLVARAILGNKFDLQGQSLDLVEIQGTIEQISVDKCRKAADAVRLWTQ
jgi:inosine triphosphate pyrophosphatase